MPLKIFWATIAAQIRKASCSAVCSFAISSAVRGRRDGCFAGSAAHFGTLLPVVTGDRLARLRAAFLVSGPGSYPPSPEFRGLCTFIAHLHRDAASAL
jgi:hypothetical protein